MAGRADANEPERLMMNHKKYQLIKGPKLQQRQWPNREIVEAPIWCSVDLRDGNQALDSPMDLEAKVEFFKNLIDIGFKEIEVGFPAASDTEFAFCRYIINNHLVPDDVTIQVLTPARELHIHHSFEAIRGAKRAIMHLYLPTSTTQRNVVLNMSKAEVKQLAVQASQLIWELAESDDYKDIDITFEFSPESFMGTEIDFAVEVCDAVCDVWQPTENKKIIINLPNTVEVFRANVYADMVEYFATHTRWRDQMILSVHTHNDRGGGVVASELAILAGAERVEGTLFGNGERTGNCDIVTMALNLYASGIDPKLDFSQIEEMKSMYERLTNMLVPPRQPYAGSLVFTAFSGSHQDAIRKGMANLSADEIWRVPYLPVDPHDLGREYDPIIRINSQSGGSGVAYVLEYSFGIILPKFAQLEVSEIIKEASNDQHKELIPADLITIYRNHFINRSNPLKLEHYSEEMLDDKQTSLTVEVAYEKKSYVLQGTGTGPVDALNNIFCAFFDLSFEVTNYQQQALNRGSNSRAMTFTKISHEGRKYFGAGESGSATKSALRALVTAVNRFVDDNPAAARKLETVLRKM